MKRANKPGRISLPVSNVPELKISHDGVLDEGDVKIGAKGMQIDSARRNDNHAAEAKESKYQDDENIDEYVDIVQEDLEVLKDLGEGTSGTVKKVRHRRTGKLMAVKNVPLEVNPEMRKQILLELRTLHNTSDCPHIVSFYGAFMQEGVVSIALEYMEVGSLADVVVAGGAISERIICHIANHVVRGLHYLHKTKHIVHRDLKPHNLLVNRKGHTKVADFGMSGEMDNSLDMKVSFVGTASYMSPERMIGGEYSFASDVWSLGLTLMECALGRYPYPPPGSGATISSFWDLLDFIQREDPPEMDSSRFSPQFCDFVNSCVSKEVSDRPLTPELLTHPFLSMYDDDGEGAEVELAEWVNGLGLLERGGEGKQ